MYFDQKSFDNQLHPSDMSLPAVQPFGITFDDGSVVTAKKIVKPQELSDQQNQELNTKANDRDSSASDAVGHDVTNNSVGKIDAPPDGKISIGDQIHNDDELLASKGEKVGTSNLAKLRADIQTNIAEIQNSNAPSGNKLVSIAEQLGRDPIRWQSKTTGKCNQFVGEAIKCCFGTTPWEGPPPTCHGMISALRNSSDWEIVWTAEKKEFNSALKEFQTFEPHQGDVAIWDNSAATHSGVLDEDRMIYYAGSRQSPTGYAKTDIKNYTGTPEAPLNYGAPTIIFRHKNSIQWTK